MHYFVSQRTHVGCAQACLEMILLANGYNIGPRKIRQLNNHRRSLSIRDMQAILSIFSIKSTAYFIKSNKIVDILQSDFMLLHHRNHYYLVESLGDDKYSVYNPAWLRPHQRNGAYIEHHWDGYFMTFAFQSKVLPLYACYPFVPAKIRMIGYGILGILLLLFLTYYGGFML